jgi:hypothetical protein
MKDQFLRAWYVLVLGLSFSVCDGLAAAEPPPPKVRVLIVTGIDYPGHLWRKTAPEVAAAIRRDNRLEVFTVEDPNFLDSAALTNYSSLVLHFQNWQTAGPGSAARTNLARFVQSGGGLISLHFACGAWQGEWPEFVDILGRVYDPKLPPHDPYGKFRVQVVDAEQGVQIAELSANANIKKATGDSESTRLRALGEALAIRAIGQAKSEAYRVGVESLGAQGYTLMQLMQIVGDRNVRIVPDVAVTGQNANPGLIDGMLGIMLRQQTTGHLSHQSTRPPNP